MNRKMVLTLPVIILVVLITGSAISVENKKMPKEDVIDVPAIGEGLCVHNLFQSNMVLQRDKPVAVWGWAAPGEQVTVSFAGQTQTATADKDRAWKVMLTAMPANAQPQKMTVQGKDTTLTLDNILVGDVWVLGGQSNMEAPLTDVENGQLEIVSANYAGIRILTIPALNGHEEKKGFPRLHEWSGWFKQHFCKGDWDVCTPEVARQLSAIGHVFARRIHMASQVPIGVIDTSRGGTTVETWTPAPVLRTIDTKEVKDLLAAWDKKVADFDPKKDLETRVQNHRNWVKDLENRGEKVPADQKEPTDLNPGPAMDSNRPGNGYASMIAPIAGFAVKGAIFHQGYNNCFEWGSANADRYYQIFGKMITAWRAAFNDPNMPFGIISLPTAGTTQTRDNYLEMMTDTGIYIREAQHKTFLDFFKAGDKNIGYASSFDKRHPWYHPLVKIPVGERISRWALATQYGMNIKWKPPVYTEMKVEDGKIILRMEGWVRSPDDTPIVGFAIAGEDRRFQPAEANYLVTGKDQWNRPQTDPSVLVLTSPHVPKPVHFRYAWGRNPMGNLQEFASNDLPFAPQRSDDWKMEEVPVKWPGSESMSPKDYAAMCARESQKALRLDDMQRRLKEAQTFIDGNKEKYEKDRAAFENEQAKARERIEKASK
jgi:sialate O-acetylesterase